MLGLKQLTKITGKCSVRILRFFIFWLFFEHLNVTGKNPCFYEFLLSQAFTGSGKLLRIHLQR
jgi:hypothetical protein